MNKAIGTEDQPVGIDLCSPFRQKAILQLLQYILRQELQQCILTVGHIRSSITEPCSLQCLKLLLISFIGKETFVCYDLSYQISPVIAPVSIWQFCGSILVDSIYTISIIAKASTFAWSVLKDLIRNGRFTAHRTSPLHMCITHISYVHIIKETNEKNNRFRKKNG